MVSDNENNSSEDNLFAAEMRGVKPLKPIDKVVLTPPVKTSTHSFYRKEIGVKEGGNSSNGDAYFSLELKEGVASHTLLHFCRSGVQTSLIRKLKRGQMAVEAELDLHGYRVEQALILIQTFIADALARHFRVISIIHGKGLHANEPTIKHSTLKSYVAQWLPEIPDVLAFVSAPQRLGGTGAVLILLKQKHPNGRLS